MIVNFHSLAEIRANNLNKRIVLSSGSFDLLHVNHLHYLRMLRNYGNIVVVMVASDARIAASKGESRPIIPEADRAELLNGLRATDYVFIEPGVRKRGEVDPVYVEAFAQLKPDVFVTTNENWAAFKDIMSGAELIVAPRIARGAHASTTAIIERVKSVPDDAI